jgi:Flp pilus assembly protein TadG
MTPRQKGCVRPKGLARHRSAVAALEFGLIAPVFAVFLLGLVDLADAIIAIRKLNLVAEQTGLIATQLSVQPNQTTTLTVAQLNEASSVIFAVWPKLASLSTYNAISEPVPAYAVVVSDVVFVPTTAGCTAGLTCTSYTANLAWSVPLQYGQQIHRICGTIVQASPTAQPVIVNNLPSTVPTSKITSALTSTLVVDVVYQYTPIFAKFLGSFTMRQTAFFNQRSIVSPYITYNTSGAASGGVVCTGYS